MHSQAEPGSESVNYFSMFLKDAEKGMVGLELMEINFRTE